MDYFDVYDIDRVKTGKQLERHAERSADEFSSVIHLCIFNSRGEMLIQQRQPFKSTWPGLWDVSVGGGITAGENPRQAVTREVKEELGLNIDLTDIRPKLTVNYGSGFDDFFLITEDIVLNDLKLQSEEVADARWASRDEIKAMLSDGTFIPYYASLIDCLFDMRDRYGAHANEVGSTGSESCFMA